MVNTRRDICAVVIKSANPYEWAAANFDMSGERSRADTGAHPRNLEIFCGFFK